MFVVFYTANLYIRIYDLFHILLSLWHDYWSLELRIYVCMYVSMYVYIYMCVCVCVCVCVLRTFFLFYYIALELVS
jgi:hypothetical protein